ncbi:MAG: hypothetical protein LBQ66_11385, partial [Planctomycetaceae bacterium]|nr:hypothetical protein [Planctomycetaceae bacterium]
EGANYAKSLSSFTSDALRHGGVLAEIIGIRVDYHVTFDKDGQITDAEHTNSKSKSRVLPTNKTLFNKLTWHGNNLINLKLKQYAFDKNRLTQHETGEESAFDTFTIGKDEKGSFSIAVNSNALYNIAKSQSTT